MPLSEISERYILRIEKNAVIMREIEVNAPAYFYDLAAQTADGVTAPFEVSVAQISEQYGPGPFRRITFDG